MGRLSPSLLASGGITPQKPHWATVILCLIREDGRENIPDPPFHPSNSVSQMQRFAVGNQVPLSCVAVGAKEVIPPPGRILTHAVLPLAFGDSGRQGDVLFLECTVYLFINPACSKSLPFLYKHIYNLTESFSK